MMSCLHLTAENLKYQQKKKLTIQDYKLFVIENSEFPFVIITECAEMGWVESLQDRFVFMANPGFI